MAKQPDIRRHLARPSATQTLTGAARIGGHVPKDPQRILLVDGSAPDARRVSGFLRSGGFGRVEIDHVQTLAAAIAALEVGSFDVAIVDLALGDAGGTDTVSRLQLVAPKLPIIVLSTEDDEAQGLQSVQLGAQDYLPKSAIDGPSLSRSMRYARERKRVEQRLAILAHYDQLTGVANRAMFRDRLQLTLTQAALQNQRFSVLFLDLDRFKSINDSLGHVAGDAVLVEVARRLALCMRERDMVARLGGDEFAILLDGVSQDAQITEVAFRILTLLSEPIIVDNTEVPLTASVGASVYPFSASSMEGMLRAADAAMYRAKGRGRSNFELCTGDALVPQFGRLRMETALRRGLERDEFTLDYQPQVDLRTGRIASAEALLRWHGSLGSGIGPNQFVPVLEDTGLIVDVGRWALRRACREIARRRAEGWGDIRIAVNVSPRQFDVPGLASAVESALATYGVSPASLELELTESLLMRDNQHTMSTLHELKEIGVRLAIDDFGTGYSSLAYLHRFPVDMLKIDRAFVDAIAKGGRSAIVVGAIVSLGHRLGLEVVAEGVETVEQLDYLRREGCDFAQGFYVGTPTSAETLLSTTPQPFTA